MDQQSIVRILDDAASAMDFPMLDNGYTYLADVRMTLFRGGSDWALVIEQLGCFNHPPSVEDAVSNHLYSFGNCILGPRPEGYVSREAYERAVAAHPFDATHSVFPISDGPSGPWLDLEQWSVPPSSSDLRIREQVVPIPRSRSEFDACGVKLGKSGAIRPEELLRVLVSRHRDLFRATDGELRKSIAKPGLSPILQLDEWEHPDLANGQNPSATSTFQGIAAVLATGNVSLYRPSDCPNTHWKHWPTGGTL